ncbi:hypothetical protein Neosp_015160 [[Neocosmospora] mangrovei]
MTDRPSRTRQNRAYRDERVDRHLRSLRNRFAEGRIWRQANAPSNPRNDSILRHYNATVDLMVLHHIPLRLLWQERGIFDHVVGDASPKLSGTIAERMYDSVRQMVNAMEREGGRDPAVAWIWPPDNTVYSHERPFVGSSDEADALDTLGVDEAPLMTRSRTVTWGEFGLDPNSDGSNLHRDGRSQGNNRRARQPVQRTLSPTPEPRTPERRPVRALPAAPRRDRHARYAPYRRQPSPLLRQARPPARRDPSPEDPEPPAPRRRFRIPSPLTPPLPPRQPVEIIDLVGEDDEEGVVDPVEEEEEEEDEEEVAAGEVDGMAAQDPAITNGFLEPGPSQPLVEIRDSLMQRLEELRARRDPLMEELDSITQEISDVQAQLEGWDN